MVERDFRLPGRADAAPAGARTPELFRLLRAAAGADSIRLSWPSQCAADGGSRGRRIRTLPPRSGVSLQLALSKQASGLSASTAWPVNPEGCPHFGKPEAYPTTLRRSGDSGGPPALLPRGRRCLGGLGFAQRACRTRIVYFRARLFRETKRTSSVAFSVRMTVVKGVSSLVENPFWSLKTQLA